MPAGMTAIKIDTSQGSSLFCLQPEHVQASAPWQCAPLHVKMPAIKLHCPQNKYLARSCQDLAILTLDTQCLPAPDTTFGLVHVVPPVSVSPFASAGTAGLAYESAMAVEEREVRFPDACCQPQPSGRLLWRQPLGPMPLCSPARAVMQACCITVRAHRAPIMLLGGAVRQRTALQRGGSASWPHALAGVQKLKAPFSQGCDPAMPFLGHSGIKLVTLSG